MIRTTPTRPSPLSAAAIVLLLLALLHMTDGCDIEECAAMYSRRLNDEAVMIGENPTYCSLMSNYLECLNETSKRCRGNLKFHTLNTLLVRQLSEFNCRRFRAPHNLDHGDSSPSALATTASPPPKCYFLFDNHHRSRLRYCALFGDPHLRTFNGEFQSCRAEGAWPLVENGYFVIQVTNAPVVADHGATAVSKVTVLVKSHRHCTEHKRYEAAADDDELPTTFVDGSSHSGHSANERAVELIRSNQTHVEIRLRYVATKIYIRREGPYLSVAVRMPEEILQERTELDSGQLCVSGCPLYQTVPLKETLAAPAAFAQCFHSPIRLERDFAVEHCRSARVTDSFFDACVFDLMFTGDIRLARMAADAQADIVRLYPPYEKHYSMGRSDLSIYEHLRDDPSAWTDCKSSSAIGAPSSALQLVACALVVLALVGAPR